MEPTLKVTLSTDPAFANHGTDASVTDDNAKVCVSCHHECNFGCNNNGNH